MKFKVKTFYFLGDSHRQADKYYLSSYIFILTTNEQMFP